MNEFKPLRDILRDASRRLPWGWLYLPAHRNWMVETPGLMIDLDKLDESEMVDEDTPVVARSNDLICTLDSGTIEGIYSGARRLQNPPSDELLLQAFVYYFRFDAFLPQIDAPDPPPAHVVAHNLDRAFYDALGPENLVKKCKRDGCNRGAVSLSVLCRVHHFESVKRKPCPFED